MFGAPLGGGTATKLNDTLVGEGNVAPGFLFSPDSTLVVYRADKETDEVIELFSVPVGGGTSTKLNDTLADGGDVAINAPFTVDDRVFHVSPDSGRVVYLADQDTEDVLELFSVPIDGGGSTKLNGTLVEGGEVDFQRKRISPDGTRVVYRADQNAFRVPELFSVPIAGGTATQLNEALAFGGAVTYFVFTPDSSRVVYRANQDTAGVLELYSAPTTGGPSTKHSGPITALGDEVSHALITPDGQYSVYRADHDIDDVFELYRVNLATREKDEAERSSRFG